MELIWIIIVVGGLLCLLESDRNNCEPDRDFEMKCQERRLKSREEHRGEVQTIIDSCMRIDYKKYDPTNPYDAPSDYIACRDFYMEPLYGSDSITVVVPSHIKFLGGDLGHSELIYEEEIEKENKKDEEKEKSKRNFEHRCRLMKEEGRRRTNKGRAIIKANCILAQPSDFKLWLKGFLDKGGTPDYIRDYNRERTYLASKDFEMTPLHGSGSIDIIVPEGIIVTGNAGHGTIYRMKDFTHEGTVEVHKDTLIEGVN